VSRVPEQYFLFIFLFYQKLSPHLYNQTTLAAMSGLKRIMLIDDDPDDQIFFRDAVHAIFPDLFCEITSTCKEALKLLEIPPNPDFIFMDLNMPVMNGFECLAYLKKQKQYSDIPVVIFTTSKNPNDITKTKALGAKWYMTKPDDFNILCKKLHHIIQLEFKEGPFAI
jgi:CheY-like chemotaxis protein